jgi:SAM-dependent methyltransferase
MREVDIHSLNGRILYFAPMKRIADKLSQNLNLITVDLEMDNVDCHGDITDLPFRDNEFRSIICSHVLEHVPDDTAAINELNRVLAPNGDCFILVPTDSKLDSTIEDSSITTPSHRSEVFGQSNHVRIYADDIVERLANGGFNVNVVDYCNEFNKDEKLRMGLVVRDKDAYIGFDRIGKSESKFERIFHCTKLREGSEG